VREFWLFGKQCKEQDTMSQTLELFWRRKTAQCDEGRKEGRRGAEIEGIYIPPSTIAHGHPIEKITIYLCNIHPFPFYSTIPSSHSLHSTLHDKTGRTSISQGSTQLEITPTPTPTPVTFFLHMHNDIHAPSLQELYRALAYILHVCGTGGDDVDDA
jgi:hypothetical protein